MHLAIFAIRSIAAQPQLSSISKSLGDINTAVFSTTSAFRAKVYTWRAVPPKRVVFPFIASGWWLRNLGHFQAHSRWFLENSLLKGKEEAAWSRLFLFTWTATTPCKYFMGSSCCSIFLLSFNDILVLGFPFFSPLFNNAMSCVK